MFEPSASFSLLIILLATASMFLGLSDIITNSEPSEKRTADIVYLTGARLSTIMLFSLWYIKKTPDFTDIGQTAEFQSALTIACLLGCIYNLIDIFHNLHNFKNSAK